MRVGKKVGFLLTDKTEVRLSLGHYVHYKCYMDWPRIEFGSPEWHSGDRPPKPESNIWCVYQTKRFHVQARCLFSLPWKSYVKFFNFCWLMVNQTRISICQISTYRLMHFLVYNQWVWLRHCATSRKVAGSVPDGVIGIFHWHNPSDRTMALGLTQPLTEMSTRKIFLRVKAAGA